MLLYAKMTKTIGSWTALTSCYYCGARRYFQVNYPSGARSSIGTNTASKVEIDVKLNDVGLVWAALDIGSMSHV